MSNNQPIAIFLIGGPGSGKDYLLKNIFSRFDLTEVQVEHLTNGSANQLIESNKSMVINGVLTDKNVLESQSLLENYAFDYVFVSVTNKVSQNRNLSRQNPIDESKRIQKRIKAEKLAENFDCFVFENSLNLHESTEFEKVFFASQIQKLLERLVDLGLELNGQVNQKTLTVIKENNALPRKYTKGLTPKEIAAKKRHIERNKKLSDRDPEAYKDMPGDKRIRERGIPLSKHTVAVRKMMASEATKPRPNPSIESVAKKHNVSVDELEKQIAIGLNIEREHTLDQKEARRIAIDHLEEIPDYYTRLVSMEKQAKKNVNEESKLSLSAKAKKSGISVGTLRKVYRRGVAAWNSGHRPGTTPQQWGHARVNSYINKGKTYHTADKDLREDSDLDILFERQLEGTDEYRKHAISMTPGQTQEIDNAFENLGNDDKKNSKKTDESTIWGCDECPDELQSEHGEIEAVSGNGDGVSRNIRNFSQFKAESAEQEEVDVTPTLVAGKKGRLSSKVKAQAYSARATSDGLPVVSRLTGEEKKPQFMPTPQQVPAPPGGLPVPKGFKRVKDNILGTKLVPVTEPATVKEAVEYHLENKISFTENAFRPGSEMFFEMLKEAKRLYKEGAYEPKDEWEQDLLDSDVGEFAAYEGSMVPLDYPLEEELNEEDKTDGKGIGKPWREGGGGAVYVRDGGSIRKVSFSKSGMKKKYMDPAATRSFVARHRCLTNKDKTSASYWACRWPRFFSNSGKIWW